MYKKLLAILMLSALLLAGCSDGEGESDAATADENASDASVVLEGEWGEGPSNGIPEFEGTAYSVDIPENGNYAAAYYKEVTGEQINAYAAELEEKLGVSFQGTKYPRSAISGEKIIVLNYNVTEMLFSVTVIDKTKD